MGLFNKKKDKTPCVVQTKSKCTHPFLALNNYMPLMNTETKLYSSLREAIPIIDAAIGKLVRLTGGFEVIPYDREAQGGLDEFLRTVKVGACGFSIHSFISAYLEQLLTFGTAVGEIVPSYNGKDIAALYNASLEDLEIKLQDNPLCTSVCVRDRQGNLTPVKHPHWILLTALNPEPGKAVGVSLLKGLPFVSGILLNIYNTIGVNWERVGNIRFAVTYNPGNDAMDKAYAKERAMSIASQWSQAMQSDCGSVRDFVAVGDFNIKVIGADNQILDSSVPVKQMLEQIVAKTGLPPFLLGLSWSTTERMACQQADILTSELESYRRLLNPVIEKICSAWLKMKGFCDKVEIEWDVINLQDDVESAKARLLSARAFEIENRLINGKA